MSCFYSKLLFKKAHIFSTESINFPPKWSFFCCFLLIIRATHFYTRKKWKRKIKKQWGTEIIHNPTHPGKTTIKFSWVSFSIFTKYYTSKVLKYEFKVIWKHQLLPIKKIQKWIENTTEYLWSSTFYSYFHIKRIYPHNFMSFHTVYICFSFWVLM